MTEPITNTSQLGDCPCKISSSGNMYRHHTPDCPNAPITNTSDQPMMTEEIERLKKSESELLNAASIWRNRAINAEEELAGVNRMRSKGPTIEYVTQQRDAAYADVRAAAARELVQMERADVAEFERDAFREVAIDAAAELSYVQESPTLELAKSSEGLRLIKAIGAAESSTPAEWQRLYREAMEKKEQAK